MSRSDHHDIQIGASDSNGVMPVTCSACDFTMTQKLPLAATRIHIFVAKVYAAHKAHRLPDLCPECGPGRDPHDTDSSCVCPPVDRILKKETHDAQ